MNLKYMWVLTYITFVNSECISPNVHITQKISNEGFHRQINWLIEVLKPLPDEWLNSECNMALRLVVPHGMYVNPDEIGGNNATNDKSSLIRRGIQTITWPPSAPDFYLWAHMKQVVCPLESTNHEHVPEGILDASNYSKTGPTLFGTEVAMNDFWMALDAPFMSEQTGKVTVCGENLITRLDSGYLTGFLTESKSKTLSHGPIASHSHVWRYKFDCLTFKQSLNLLQASIRVSGKVDIEAPAHEGSEHKVIIYLNNNKIKRIPIDLPIHLRYQRSQITGGYGKVYLQKPSLLMWCKSGLNKICQSGLKVDAPCEQFGTKHCVWKNITYEALFDNADLFVPIGDLDHYPVVSIVTLLLGCAGSIYILSILSMTHF